MSRDEEAEEGGRKGGMEGDERKSQPGIPVN